MFRPSAAVSATPAARLDSSPPSNHPGLILKGIDLTRDRFRVRAQVGSHTGTGDRD